jgi:predicted metal-dependent hydrolase
MNRDERFWELHEIMEHYWKKSTGMDKMILQEIIGILVSQVKWQMGQFKVSESVLNRNVRLLEKNTEMVRDEIILGVSYPILFNPKLLDYFEQIYIA